jgi:transcriptional regulator CtsR
MPNLADFIEEYLMGLFAATHDQTVEIQRQEMARKFNCAPSQINYVLDTRFTPERGYVVESRRGGGGFIRIVQVSQLPIDWLSAVRREVGASITSRGADHILRRLIEEGVLSAPTATLIKTVIADETGDIPPPVGDVIRAMLLRSILTVVMMQANR